MGISTHVVGMRDLGGQFARMIAAKEACEEAGVSYPKELVEYFETPGETPMYLQQKMQEVNIDVAVSEDSDDGTNSWVVDLSKLPKEVKSIKFSNSY